MTRTILLAVLAAALLVAACPGPQTGPVSVPPPGSAVAPTPPPGGNPPPGQNPGPMEVLTDNLNRLRARLARYRAEKPDTPQLDEAEKLLGEAEAALAVLAGAAQDDQFPMKLHAVNTRFYQVELIIPPLD